MRRSVTVLIVPLLIGLSASSETAAPEPQQYWLASRSSFAGKVARLRNGSGGQPSPAFMSEGWSRAELHRRPRTPIAGLYVRVRFCCLTPGVEKRPKPPEASPGKISSPPAGTPGGNQPTKWRSVPVRRLTGGNVTA
jgi:hypothetical protein